MNFRSRRLLLVLVVATCFAVVVGRATADGTTTTPTHPLAGMPPLLDPTDVYAADRPNQLSSVVRGDRNLVYVPNGKSDTVDEIDPRTYKIVRHFRVGHVPQHVVPAWDLRTLWVTNDEGNSLTAINPRTGKPGRTVAVRDPYNMYFTPNGRRAIVVAEGIQKLDFRDPHTMALKHSVSVDCKGIDHIDFTADGTKMLASCEFSGKLAVFDVARERLLGTIALPDHRTPHKLTATIGHLVRATNGGGGPNGMGMPQDVKLAPDGRTFYVADMESNGVWSIDTRTWSVRNFVSTGAGTHGIYVSRDSQKLFVSNRGEGSISVLAANTGRIVRKWRLPGGGSPDMGGVSADGKVLWLSGRYDSEVYAISTRNGRLLARIKVGNGPHGLSVFPQPGRYSVGHTGVFR